MKLVSSWGEVIEVGACLLGLLGLRIHWSCNIRRCWRHELSPSGYCRKHQLPSQREGQ